MREMTIVAVAVLSVFAGSMPGAVQEPVIESVTINTSTNQITITGVNLLPSSGLPGVGLGTAGLTVVSATAGQIVAALPASLPAGSYALRVTVGSLIGRFEVTYGAQGPAGPQGPPGTLTLPFFGGGSSQGPAFAVNQLEGGYPAIGGVGGPVDSLGFAGFGTGGIGGAAVDAGHRSAVMESRAMAEMQPSAMLLLVAASMRGAEMRRTAALAATESWLGRGPELRTTSRKESPVISAGR